jgi:hypothetical protein
MADETKEPDALTLDLAASPLLTVGMQLVDPIELLGSGRRKDELFRKPDAICAGLAARS